MRTCGYCYTPHTAYRYTRTHTLHTFTALYHTAHDLPLLILRAYAVTHYLRGSFLPPRSLPTHYLFHAPAFTTTPFACCSPPPHRTFALRCHHRCAACLIADHTFATVDLPSVCVSSRSCTRFSRYHVYVVPLYVARAIPVRDYLVPIPYRAFGRYLTFSHSLGVTRFYVCWVIPVLDHSYLTIPTTRLRLHLLRAFVVTTTSPHYPTPTGDLSHSRFDLLLIHHVVAMT